MKYRRKDNAKKPVLKSYSKPKTLRSNRATLSSNPLSIYAEKASFEGGIVCPHCKGKCGTKVIAAGMPMKLCLNEMCNNLWGEPFATVYSFLIAPLEGLFNNGFSFVSYQGSYFKALIHWLRGSV